MKEFESLPGMWIYEQFAKSYEAVLEKNEPVTFQFNGVRVVLFPDENKTSVIKRANQPEAKAKLTYDWKAAHLAEEKATIEAKQTGEK